MKIIKPVLIAAIIGALVLLYGNYQAYMQANAQIAPDLVQERIDAAAIVKDLPLTFREHGQSDNGRLRDRWLIDNHENQRFEVIGNDQADADKMAWACADFDAAGGYILPTDPNHRCHRFFTQVLGNFVANPELVASYLIRENAGSTQDARAEAGDLSFEVSGWHYVIRRGSRMDSDF